MSKSRLISDKLLEKIIKHLINKQGKQGKQKRRLNRNVLKKLNSHTLPSHFINKLPYVPKSSDDPNYEFNKMNNLKKEIMMIEGNKKLSVEDKKILDMIASNLNKNFAIIDKHNKKLKAELDEGEIKIIADAVYNANANKNNNDDDNDDMELEKKVHEINEPIIEDDDENMNEDEDVKNFNSANKIVHIKELLNKLLYKDLNYITNLRLGMNSNKVDQLI